MADLSTDEAEERRKKLYPRHEETECICGVRMTQRYVCTACDWTSETEGEWQWSPQGHGHYFMPEKEMQKETLDHWKTHAEPSMIVPADWKRR